jgi:hypothetical protein
MFGFPAGSPEGASTIKVPGSNPSSVEGLTSEISEFEDAVEYPMGEDADIAGSDLRWLPRPRHGTFFGTQGCDLNPVTEEDTSPEGVPDGFVEANTDETYLKGVGGQFSTQDC